MISKYKLFRLQCQDLLVLQEMEYNGLLFDKEAARIHAKDIQGQLERLLERFNSLIGCNIVNISSNDHMSAVLYGGTIIETIRIPVGFYATGKRKGEVRFKIQLLEHQFEKLVDPIKGTETAKSILLRESGKTTGETIWKVSEDMLKKLHPLFSIGWHYDLTLKRLD